MKSREELRALRVAAGLTQKQLAEKAGISLKTVIKYESGSPVRPATENRLLASLNEVLEVVPYKNLL